MIVHHLKIALRNLWRYKSQTLIGVLGLATACVVFAICCFGIFTVLLRNAEIPDNERMYRIRTPKYKSITGNVNQMFGELSGIEKFTIFRFPKQYYGNLLTNGDESERFIKFEFHEADKNYWNFFSLQALTGDVQNILNQPNSIVLYESKAKRVGNIDALQGSLVIINDVTFTITGILKDPPMNNNNFYGDGLVFNQENGYFQQTREALNPWNENIIVMLAKGISKDDFQKTLDSYPFVYRGDQNSELKELVYIESINEIEQDFKFILITAFIVVLLVLSVALFNIISFQTAQFYNRLKECAIRKVAGSGKRQLLLAFYMEILIIFILSFFLGLMVIDLLKSVVQEPELAAMLQNEAAVSGIKKHLLFSVLFGLSATFLFCLIPVQIISRQSVNVIYMGLSEKISKQRGRKIMLFIQMLILLLFLSGTLIIRLQVDRVKENIWKNLSQEEQKNIFTLSYDNEQTPAQFEVILQQLRQSSAVDDVSFSRNPLSNYGYLDTKTIGKHEKQSVREYKVSSNFVDFFNAKIVKGRFWDENDTQDVIVVDETLAALFPDNNPLGMNIDGKVIIGVLENIQMVKENQTFSQMKNPVFYSRIEKIDNWGCFYIKAIRGKSDDVKQHIMQIQKEFYPEFSQNFVDFQTDIRRSTFEGEDMLSMFFGVFSIICLILCLLSIYSAITMNTEKRRKEVAIRKINGAEIKDIILLFSKSYLLLWSVVCLLMFPVIYFAGNLWLETFNQRISLNVFFFSAIYFSILALILLMIIFRIMEVARCNPAEVVKGN